MTATVCIDVTAGPEQGRRFDVPAGGFTIGRARGVDGADCLLAGDLSVSRRHARGRVENGRILLEDWPDPPSKAGLLVRGKRVPSARLVSGETVTLGRSTLVFHLGARPRVRRLPAVREWRLPVAFLAAGLAGAAAVRSVAAGRAAAVEPDRLVLAWSARDAGELRQAVQLLEEPAALAVRTPEAETLVRDCRRNERQFETPRRLEESLRLDEARDAWARLALGMPEGDPLRAWVETACVARISRRLAEMRP